MIKFILGVLGYSKIPLEVVQLSIAQEAFIQKMLEHEQSEKGKDYLEKHLEGQKTLTSFLRSGRKLGC